MALLSRKPAVTCCFEKSAVQWGNATTPKTERRLSYEVGKNGSGDACAINLHS